METTRTAASTGNARARAAASEDRLVLRGLHCMCHMGVEEAERRERQRIEVDLELYADLQEAGRTGDLDRTIDYREVVGAVRSLLETGTWHLLEAAATRVLDLLLERFEAARAVVRLRKFVLPGLVHVEVQMERARERAT